MTEIECLQRDIEEREEKIKELEDKNEELVSSMSDIQDITRKYY